MSEHLWFDVEQKRETDSAYLFDFIEEGEEFWIPKSQVGAYLTDDDDEKIVRVELTHWIAKQKGLVEE